MTMFAPLTRCPGVAGVECQALIDSSSTQTCGSCRGLSRLLKDAGTGQSAKPRRGRSSPEDNNGVPPCASPRGPISTTTLNKNRNNHGNS